MVYRLRISRIGAGGKEHFYTAFGSGFTSKKKAHESAMRMKKTMLIDHVRVVKRKTKGNLRGRQHNFPLSRYKTQTQRGTAPKRTW